MVDTSAVPTEDSSLFQVVRVSRDGESAIVKRSTGVFEALSLKTGENLFPAITEFAELAPLDRWRKVASDEVQALTASVEASSIDIVTVIHSEVKPYRVPSAVQQEIREAIVASSGMDELDIERAKALAYDDTVGRKEIEWIDSYFGEHAQPQRLRGGYKGQKWASRILSPESNEDLYHDPSSGFSSKRYEFDDDAFAYYAAGPDAESTEATELYAVDFSTGTMYVWGIDGFDVLDGASVSSFEAPQLILIDQYTAETFARWIDDSDADLPIFDVLDTDPEERNLFALAEASLDFEELDRVSSLIAAGVGKYGGIDLVPGDYTPEERSINAKRQVRGQGGKFGGAQIKPGVELLGYTKARLESELPLVENPAGRIQEFIANAPVTAAGTTSVTNGAANPNPAAPAPAPAPAAAPAAPAAPQQEAVDKATQPDASAPILYFAIVDNTDKTAVLNVAGITKTAEGTPQAFKRENAAWVADEAILGQLTGATPPPVVELAAPDPAKGILAQIDQHDASKEEFPTDAIPNDPAPAAAPPAAPVTASLLSEASARGYALPSGELAIFDASDLESAVANFATTEEDQHVEAKAHIIKRAFALNRMDLVPEGMRTLSLSEKGQLQGMSTPLYSTFGELLPQDTALVAAGHRGGNTESLMNYWAFGKGAAKIRWGTGGDLTRAHKHLSKYVTPKLAWGLAQNLHKRVMGVSNIVHDRATGQYEGRGKRR